MYTQKETSMLNDLKEAEQLCVDKYQKYAGQAHAPELKTLFTQLGSKEQQHLQTITQLCQGTMPQLQAGGQSGQAQQTTQPKANYGNDQAGYQNDSYLCADALSTEKQVSSHYDVSIFEFQNTQVRQALNHIQKEEQEHGEMIYQYMAANGMYN